MCAIQRNEVLKHWQQKKEDPDVLYLLLGSYLTWALLQRHDSHASLLRGYPPEAYEYVVNGKSALDWVVERQGVKTDKDSGIVNDANDWAIETMNNPRYPLELFQRVVTVSL
jgi:hypothetical protein